jgi:large subunit ribosomal protein L29
MKPSDLREKSQDDLRELEKSLARDVFQNRLKNFTNRLDDTSAMRKTKRDLARVKTLLHEAATGLVRVAKPAAERVAREAEAPEAKPAKKAAPKAEAKAAAVPPAAESKPKKAAAKSKKSAKTESEAK